MPLAQESVQSDVDLSAPLVFQIDGGDIDQFHVIRYRGNEGLCQLYRFEIELRCVDFSMDLDAVIGTTAKLLIGETEEKRVFHGLVNRFDYVGEGPDAAYYRAELVPQHWLLTQRYNSRIFQGQDVPTIVNKILTDANLPPHGFRDETQEKYEQRDFCVQYRETDLNFICRLMEEEGIWWSFEHAEDKHVLVIADKPASFLMVEGQAQLPYVSPDGLGGGKDQVVRFRRTRNIRPGVTSLTDYNFENPTLNLGSESDRGRDAGLQFQDFPGRYMDQSAGQRRALVRAEEFESSRDLGVGVAQCKRLAPARKFTLTEHPSDSLNTTYIVTSVTHEGQQSGPFGSAQSGGAASALGARAHQDLLAARNSDNETIRGLAEAILAVSGRLSDDDPTSAHTLPNHLFHGGELQRDLPAAWLAMGGSPLEALALPALLNGGNGQSAGSQESGIHVCRFECMPDTAPYRPPRVTPWPVMRGTQTARVVGKGGEEIDTDKYGRVKVQFPWDRDGKFDDKSSCWIRVSQVQSGGNYGVFFLPRVGQEVIVDFLEGDPDKPIIIGSVPNADHLPPYDLPAEKTKSVIKTHSSKGGGGTNEIRFEDLKDGEQLLIRAQKDFHLRVLEEERHNVGAIQHLTVGDEQRVKIEKHRSTDVAGKDALHVADSRSVAVDGDVIEAFGKNHGHKVASDYLLKANKVVVEAPGGISFKVGGNFIAITTAGVFIKGTKIGLNSGGAALTSSASTSPVSPAEPEEADDVTPGQDANYSGEPRPLPKIQEKPFKGQWISIDLKDKEGEPVAGEYYEIETPAGKVLKGTLDVNGFARRWVPEEGNCQITFPMLKSSEWSRG